MRKTLAHQLDNFGLLATNEATSIEHPSPRACADAHARRPFRYRRARTRRTCGLRARRGRFVNGWNLLEAGTASLIPNLSHPMEEGAKRYGLASWRGKSSKC